ncbi:MAG: 30S ribosomal protein S6 [Parcubacteria group bacterium]|nr:30S ribosomal protein S6 [Parcubacteria group bacterium]
MPNYEWTLLLDPVLEEKQARQQVASAASLVQEGGGIVQSQEVLGKRPLPSTIRKHREVNLARIEATIAQDRVEAVAKKLDEIPAILRIMLTIKRRRAPMPPRRQLHRSVLKTPVQAKEKMDVREIDKKIEELLQEPQI